MKIIVSLLACGLLVGCSQSLLKPDAGSVWYLPPVGTMIELHKPLTVPGGQTRVFLQRGEVAAKQAFDRYVPSCNFELRKLSQDSREIAPETFFVVRVQRETAEVVRQVENPIKMAGLGLVGRDNGLPMVVHSVHLWVGSVLQPDVMRLTCRGAFDDPSEAEPPSIQQMGQALGSYASLRLPE